MRQSVHVSCYLLCSLPFCFSAAAAQNAPTSPPWIASGGPSGGLNIPDGRVLSEGEIAFSLNDYRGREFASYDLATNYLFGIGLFKYVELTGRLAHYRGSDRRRGLVRDLSANIKLSMPQFFSWQPDIALGVNDLAGGAPNFKSKYLSVSDQYGPVRLIAGAADGGRDLGRVFGSAEVLLWDTGASVLVERNKGMNSAGVRYASPALKRLGDARILLTAQRPFDTTAPDGRTFDKPAFGVTVVIPLGDQLRGRGLNGARAKSGDDAQVGQHAPHGFPPARERREEAAVSAGSASAAGAGVAATRDGPNDTTVIPAQAGIHAEHAGPGTHGFPPARERRGLEQLRGKLISAGLERVRVGVRGSELIVEYENHRFNRNEIDAVGIVLGAAALFAPDEVATVSAVSKKAGSRIFIASVGRSEFRRYLIEGGDAPALSFHTRPSVRGVAWQDGSGPRGYSRLRIDPQLAKFVGTELGVFDYSLAANIQLFVPLWQGAEFTGSYITTIAESDDVAHGFFGWAQQRDGLKSAVVSQAFWLTDRIANVTSLGTFIYDGYGIQNETMWFAPYSDDQVRVQYTRVREDLQNWKRLTQAGSVSYLWHYIPMQMSVELGFNRYRASDKGPFLQMNRWFGDVQVQLYVKKTDAENRVGFGLAFPLTPRKGMRPGFTHLEGSPSYPLRLETKLASPGECNCITAGVMEEIPMVYKARLNLFNNARFGERYFQSQLPRMREAAQAYVTDEGD